MQRRHVPNLLTVARLVLAIAFFAMLNVYRFEVGDTHAGILIAALVLFLVAAFTDFLDGYLARRWAAVTLFGRIVDPVADKILVIGGFIYFAGPRFVNPDDPTDMLSGVYPWMVVVILLRELAVTSIRAAMESQGIDFSARSVGKWKMVLQVVAIPVVIVAVALDPLDQPWVRIVRDLTVWATVIVTILSGLPYVTGALRAVRQMPVSPPGEGGGWAETRKDIP